MDIYPSSRWGWSAEVKVGSEQQLHKQHAAFIALQAFPHVFSSFSTVFGAVFSNFQNFGAKFSSIFAIFAPEKPKKSHFSLIFHHFPAQTCPFLARFLAPNLPLCGPLETKFSKFSKFWRQKSPKMPQICPFYQLCFK